jgi:hypothetical protein
MKRLRSKGKLLSHRVRGVRPIVASSLANQLQKLSANGRTASHFFRDSPSRDEKAAIADGSDIDFDAGIQDTGVKKKREYPFAFFFSLFFFSREDKLPGVSLKRSLNLVGILLRIGLLMSIHSHIGA